MGCKHLDYLKRCQILVLYKAGYTQTQIAEEAGVHKSTISREFNRNSTLVRTQRGYWANTMVFAKENPSYSRVIENLHDLSNIVLPGLENMVLS